MYWTYLKTITFVLTLALIFGGGYVLYREKKVEDYEQLLLNFNPTSYAEKLDLANHTESAVCTSSGSNFDGAISTISYHHNGKILIETLAQGQVSERYYEMFDANDSYLWIDDGLSIMHATRDSDVSFEDGQESLPLFEAADCKVWWLPDDRVFDIMPAARPIVEY